MPTLPEAVSTSWFTTSNGVRRRSNAPAILLNWFSGKGLRAITFILEHPEAIESYLREQGAAWNEFREGYPSPDEMIERLRRTRDELSRRPA
jgi:hypothetical protein